MQINKIHFFLSPVPLSLYTFTQKNSCANFKIVATRVHCPQIAMNRNPNLKALWNIKEYCNKIINTGKTKQFTLFFHKNIISLGKKNDILRIIVLRSVFHAAVITIKDIPSLFFFVFSAKFTEYRYCICYDFHWCLAFYGVFFSKYRNINQFLREWRPSSRDRWSTNGGMLLTSRFN